MTDQPVAAPTPARPDEVAVLVDLLRVVVAHVLIRRKQFHLRVSAKAQAAYPEGVVVRTGVTKAGDIDVWLEPSRPGMRRGVVYLGREAPPTGAEAGATVAAEEGQRA